MSDPRETGIITLDVLRILGYLPDVERLEKGPVAIYECIEEIPCNVCVSACPVGAISMARIIDLPKIDFNKCIGCALCVGKCPGQAVFVIDASKKSEGKGYVTLPYELLPRPQVGKIVQLLNREGKVVGKGKIVKMYEDNKTYVITVEVPKDLVLNVRAVRIETGD
jgi:formate hydrogenlyase subunit 6/NADH:ubiquinone oxidoreductase subunit I